jgi:hypothetical protein
VIIGDGMCLPITHIGSTSLSTEAGNANINDVLVVPKMQKNLLSIFKFCNDNPCNIEFDNQKFVIKDRRTQLPIQKGATLNELYQTGISKIKTSIVVWGLTTSKPAMDLWQRYNKK